MSTILYDDGLIFYDDTGVGNPSTVTYTSDTFIDSGIKHTGLFRNQTQLFNKFYDLTSLSSEFVLRALSSLRVSPTPAVNYSNFKEHTFFNIAELKTKSAISKILNEYPIGISGASTTALFQPNIGAVDNFIFKLSPFEKYVLDYIGGATGDYTKYQSPTITAAATSENNTLLPLITINRNSANLLTGNQVTLTANLLNIATSFDAGLNTYYLSSGTSTDAVVYFDDGNIITSTVLPLTATEYVNRSSKIDTLLPYAYFVNDDTDTLQKYVSVIGAIFDDIKLYIDEFSNINHVSYDDYHRVPDGEIQQLLAKHFGVELISPMSTADISKYLRQEYDTVPLYKIANKIWNRVLNNLIYILKKKGTKEAVDSFIRCYGLPANYLQIDDYSFHPEPALQTKIEYKNTNVLNLNGTRYITIPPFPFKQIITNTGFESTLSPWGTGAGLTATRITTEYNSGIASVDINQSTTSNGVFTFSIPFIIVGGKKYRVSFAAKAMSGDDHLVCRFTGVTQSPITITPTWTTYTVDMTSVNSPTANFVFYLTNPGWFRLDDVFVYEMQSPATLAENENYTFEARINSSALGNSYIYMYGDVITGSSLSYSAGQINFRISDGTNSTLVSTPISTSASLINALSTDSNFVNVFGIRNGGSALVYATWVDNSSNSATYNTLSSASSVTISAINNVVNSSLYVGSSGVILGLTGNIQEVKIMRFSLNEEDIKEHTRNFESISYMNTSNATLSGIIGQWKLKENIVLSGGYGTIINSLNSTATGSPSGTLTSLNSYKMIEQMRKETNFTNMGDFIDDNIQTYVDSTASKFKKSNILHIGLKPINSINSDIINVYGNINIGSLISDPSNFYDYSVKKPYYGYSVASTSAQLVFSRYKSKINFRDYIKAVDNIGVLLNGIITNIGQLIPARTDIANRGVTIEPHLLEHSRVYKPKDTYTTEQILDDRIPIIDSYTKNIFDNSVVVSELIPQFSDVVEKTILDSSNILGDTITFVDSWSSTQQSTLDYYPITGEQLYYVSKDETINTVRVISSINDVNIFPIEQRVYNPIDTNLRIFLNRNFIKNDSNIGSTLSIDWRTSISGSISLIRKSTGKAIMSQQKTVRIELPHSSSGNSISVTDNWFIVYVNGNLLDETKTAFDFEIQSKRGLSFVLLRKLKYLNLDIGVLNIVVTNLLNGVSQKIPIILTNDESGFGGILQIDNEITV